MFINADIYVSTGQGITGANMFTYCGNDPANYVDYTGCLSWKTLFNIATIVTIVAAVMV